MKKIRNYLLFTICLFFISSNLYAGMGGFGPGGHGHGGPKGDFHLPKGKWWRIPDIATKLNLTADEQTKLDEMFYEIKKNMIDTHSNIAKLRLNLEQLLEKDPLDESSCLENFEKIKAEKTKMGIERFKFLLEVRKLLGVDRFVQLKSSFHMFKKGKKRFCPYKDKPDDEEAPPEDTRKRKRWWN